MGLKAGIVGLPNVGKSTLFNALTNSQVEAANYPFATIEPNSAIVELEDFRIKKLAQIVKTNKVVPATFEFTDIAGIVKGASKGEGLGNKFLSHIREVNAIIQVVRCFDDVNITHVSNKIDPINDVKIINYELLIADLQTINNVLLKVSKKALKTQNKDLMEQHLLATKIKESLEDEKPIRELFLEEKDKKILKNWNLLTIKPLIYIGNIDEKYISNPNDSHHFKSLKNEAIKQGVKVMAISAQIESELAILDGSERQLFLDEYNIKESSLSRLTRIAYETLSLETFFTAGIQEVHAWTFKKGMLAPECAGIIHSDFQEGFIKAQVVSYNDFIENEGLIKSKEKGKLRLEGKTYIFQDGDVVEFRFNK